MNYVYNYKGKIVKKKKKITRMGAMFFSANCIRVSQQDKFGNQVAYSTYNY